ncbi:MAG: hypothetical protein Rubg2KO_20420 [Rubricoccaceae bacterium]
MDFIADFFPFLLLLLYAVLQLLRRRTSPETTAPESETPQDGSTGQTDLDELAKHLEALITGSPVEAKPPPPPEPRYEPEFHNAEVEVNEALSFQHERHGFGAENPFSEESFERQPAFHRTRRSVDTTFDPHELKRQPEPRTTPASSWRTRLADPQRAREAFVLKTILERRQR